MGVECSKCKTENTSDSEFCKKCATPLPSSKGIPVTETLETPKEELTTGSTFAGRYQIIEELGKGGMGKVYKAHDTKIREKIALKLIKPEIAKDKKTIERFNNELRIARRIRHKNVCQMFDLGEDKGTHFITMEFVDGQDLKKLIRQTGQLALGTTINIAKQVCDGLVEAHTLGVVHRDLKPSNIMIDSDGNARIMDFGIARSLESKGITGAGVMIGTPEYMSPEQVEGKETDQRSDIYSLGVILYEMVTGQVPFEGDTPFTIGVKHKSEIPKDPKELNAQIPDDLSRVILRCMEKDKEKRHQSAEEVHSKLANIEKGIPTTERVVPKRKPITSREITVTFGLKKLFIPALVVIALIVAAVIVWQILPQKRTVPIPSDKPSLAIVYFENNSGDKSLDNWRSGLSELLITDLSQSKFLNVLSGDKIFGILKKLNLLEAQKYSAEDLTKVANQGRVNHILKGSYIKAGENFIITVMLQKPHSGEVVRSIKVECKGEEEITSKVDELTRQIKLDLNLSREQIASDIDKEVGKITTSSPEAYRHYSEAKKYFYKPEYRKAIQLFERAIEIDSEFAMAYMLLASAYSNLGYSSKNKEYIQKAFELTDRVSDRERYEIEGDFYFWSWKTFDKAIDSYKKLLELYPEYGSGNNMLGLTYAWLEQWDKAIERYEVNVKNKREAFIYHNNLVAAYRAKGLYDKAREVLENFQNNFSDIAPIHFSLAYNYLCQGKYDLALVEMDKGFSLNPTARQNFTIKGDIYHCNGDFIKAEKEYQKLQELEELDHLICRDRMGALYLLQ